MTDRELLELAAKSYGIKVRWHQESHYGPTMEIIEDESGGSPWNPLTDDGDALRLAVKLRMQLSIGDVGMVTAYAADAVQCHAEDVTEDVAYCTRRAIVRSAAEIGKLL